MHFAQGRGNFSRSCDFCSVWVEWAVDMNPVAWEQKGTRSTHRCRVTSGTALWGLCRSVGWETEAVSCQYDRKTQQGTPCPIQLRSYYGKNLKPYMLGLGPTALHTHTYTKNNMICFRRMFGHHVPPELLQYSSDISVGWRNTIISTDIPLIGALIMLE